ncbi:hypothetical protein [Streptomyces sp. NPDC048551]|uniref:hypothetical protein n=1 Tax=Streptomyces sp. NPDC048551 TaxID=3155758 RepID=UPI0034419692
MTTTVDVTDTVQQDTIRAWQLFDAPARGAFIGEWATSLAADGQPIISAFVAGRNAEFVLRRFGAHHGLLCGRDDDQKPVLAYSARGATVTWRTCGVWVQLTAA